MINDNASRTSTAQQTVAQSQALSFVPSRTAQTSLMTSMPRSDAKSSGVQASSESKWNTSKLGMRVAGDVAAASTAGGLVSPLICMLDRAIIENASNRATISDSLRKSAWTLLTRPHAFFFARPFGLIFMLYTSTYIAANTIDTVHSTIFPRKATSDNSSGSGSSKAGFADTTSGTGKFAATSATNISLCLFKDSHFTKMFGVPGAAPKPVPLVTMALFSLRDCFTVFASFNVPSMLGPRLPLSEAAEQYVSRASVAQFIAPAAAQIFSTPMHLLGLDYYNRPSTSRGVVAFFGNDGRLQKVTRDWAKSCLARIGRIVPAFGFGGVVNTHVRRTWMENLED